ncbi:MAG: YqcC family protein [Comamonas sp.]|nr:YqcC family protein [Comamonas sp.]
MIPTTAPTSPPSDLRPLLHALEAAMREADFWDALPPTEAALASTLPFMVDTLRIEQWLQWVFLPRLHALLDAQAPLPGACSVHPLAEYEWLQRAPGVASQTVLAALLAIDTHLTQGAQTRS